MGSYAAWIWKCLAQYDDYDHPGNVKPFGFKSDRKEKFLHSRNESDDWDVELRASWASREAVLGNAIDITSPAPAAPSAEPAASETRPRGSSFVKVGGRLNFSLTNDVDAANAQASRGRANSSSALLGGITTVSESQPQSPPTESTELAIPKRPVSYISVTGTGLDRRASYNHTRDTAFEEYVKQHRARQSQGSITSNSGRRSSSAPLTRSRAQSDADCTTTQQQQQKLKNDVDDALGSAFGWGKGSRSSSLDSVMAGGEPPAIAVGGGAVPSAKSVRDSLGRAPSDGSERGALGSMPKDGDEPEEDDGPESDDEDRRQKNVSEASRALLGGGGEEFREVPESLRPASGGITRPRASSETIEFIVTPPPATPTEEGNGGLRKTWGAAYQP